MARNIRALSTQDLIDIPRGPLFVLNTASQIAVGGGDVFVTIVRQDGASAPIRIPMTFLAVDVTVSAPRRAILRSSHFLDAIAKGVLTAITPEDAAHINSSPDARAEYARLQEREASVRAALAARRAGRKSTVIFDSEDGSQQMNLDNKPKVQVNGARDALANFAVTPAQNDMDSTMVESPIEMPETLSAGFRAWADKLATKTQEAAVLDLRSRGELEFPQIAYLRKAAKNHPRIVAWATRVLEDDGSDA